MLGQNFFKALHFEAFYFAIEGFDYVAPTGGLSLGSRPSVMLGHMGRRSAIGYGFSVLPLLLRGAL